MAALSLLTGETTMHWYANSGLFSLQITKAEAEAAQGAHRGDCVESIKLLSEKPRIRRQLVKLSPSAVRAELAEHGAWDGDELSNHAENLQRLLWIACEDIREGL